RFTESRDAIVDEFSGVTRDRHYGKVNWSGIDFSIIDTGGYVENSEDIFESEINKQVLLAIEESDVILFMVDVISGITDLDEAIAQKLRRKGKKVIVVVNKVDNTERSYRVSEFYALGFEHVFGISSISGSGTGDLLDVIVEKFEKNEIDQEAEDNIPKYAIIGRPNVGKSSLTNALLGEDRAIVTPISGTTRDSFFAKYNKFGQEFYLIDTAGLRRKTKVHEDLEFYSVMRSIRSIERSDICIIMIDATLGVESQDLNIIGLAQKNHKGIVIVVNKWDLVEKDTNSTKKFTEEIQSKIAPFTDVPIIFTSVINKQRILKVLETAAMVYQNMKKRIPTSELNEYMLEVIEENNPPSLKGKFIKIKYVTQLPTRFPSFAFFCNLPQYVKAPYKRYLENKIRERFDFSGAPVHIYMRQK
ncbi:MAG: ribosome biogenesis GTPase Der, partial [Bacteroidetes bacterium RIFOXYA2_FULL_33_7]